MDTRVIEVISIINDTKYFFPYFINVFFFIIISNISRLIPSSYRHVDLLHTLCSCIVSTLIFFFIYVKLKCYLSLLINPLFHPRCHFLLLFYGWECYDDVHLSNTIKSLNIHITNCLFEVITYHRLFLIYFSKYY